MTCAARFLITGLFAVLGSAATSTSVATAVTPFGLMECPGNYVENTTLVNPEDPSFFDAIDKNDDGVVCIKDWGYPDGGVNVGFIVLDNQSNTPESVGAFGGRPVGSCPNDRWTLDEAPDPDDVGPVGSRSVHDANGDGLSCYRTDEGSAVVTDNRVQG